MKFDFRPPHPENIDCPHYYDCCIDNDCGIGAYHTPLDNMAGGCWFMEIPSM